jgi:hypothetical protein
MRTIRAPTLRSRLQKLSANQKVSPLKHWKSGLPRHERCQFSTAFGTLPGHFGRTVNPSLTISVQASRWNAAEPDKPGRQSQGEVGGVTPVGLFCPD